MENSEYIKERIEQITSKLDAISKEVNELKRMVVTQENIGNSENSENWQYRNPNISLNQQNPQNFPQGNTVPTGIYDPNNPNYNNRRYRKQPKIIEKPGRDLTEAFVGKYAIGILAAILIFIGLISFIGLFWDKVPDIVKFLAILAFGALLSDISILRIKKNKTLENFYMILTGIGLGISFIDITVGGNFWLGNSNGEIICIFLLILCWFFNGIYINRKLKSRVLNITLYIGIYISIPMAYSRIGESTLYTILPIIYNILVYALGIVTYKFDKDILVKHLNIFLGIITSIDLLVVQLSNWNSYTEWILLYGIALPILIIAYTQRVNNFKENKINPYTLIEYIMSYVLITLYTVAVYYGSYIASNSLVVIICSLLILSAMTLINKDNIKVSTIVAIPQICVLITVATGNYWLISFAIPLLIIAFEIKELYFGELKELNYKEGVHITLSVIFLLIGNWLAMSELDKTHLKIFTAAVLISIITTYVYSYEKFGINIHSTSGIFLIIEAWLTSFTFDLGTEFYILSLVIMIIAHRHIFIENTKDASKIISIIFFYVIFSSLSLFTWISSIFTNPNDEKLAAIIISLSMLILAISELMVAYIAKDNLLRAIEAIAYLNVNIWFISSLMLPNIAEIGITVIVLIISALIIYSGFHFNKRNIRIIGLVATIIYVFKLILFDISGDGISKILGFILSGIICLVISYIYNKVDKKYTVNES